MKGLCIVLLVILGTASVMSECPPPINIRFLLSQLFDEPREALDRLTLLCVRILGREGLLGGLPEAPAGPGPTKRDQLDNLLKKLVSRQKRQAGPGPSQRGMMKDICLDFIFGPLEEPEEP